MNKIIILFLCLVFPFCYGQTFPESPHPYPNNFGRTDVVVESGSQFLEVQFSWETFTEPEKDFIILMDKNNRVIGKYSGNALAGQSFLIIGDVLKIRLISDNQNTAYGYSLAQVLTTPSRGLVEIHVADYSKADILVGDDLKQELYNLVKDHTSLGYSNARLKMFSEIDNKDGSVRCVYTGRWVVTNTIPDASDMNTEHTWPKSLGAGTEPAQSDLHHLFPTDSYTNSKRSSYPFGTVYHAYWSKAGSTLGEDYDGRVVFEPRTDHRGNVARAIFYFSIRYRLSVPDYEENVLRTWHTQDPVDSQERERNDSICKYQRNRNPFIDHPEYVSRIADF